MIRGCIWARFIPCLCFLSLSAAAQATVVTFDSGDLARFTIHGSGGYALNPSSGTGGTSALTASGFPSAANFNLPFSNAIGTTNIISLDFFNTNNNPTNTLDMYLGFVPSPSIDFSTSLTAGPAMVLEIRNPGGGQRSITLTNRDGSTTGSTFPNSTGYVLNEWYRLTFSLNRQADSGGFAQYQAVFSQFSLGPSGTSAPVLIQQNTKPSFSQAPSSPPRASTAASRPRQSTPLLTTSPSPPTPPPSPPPSRWSPPSPSSCAAANKCTKYLFSATCPRQKQPKLNVLSTFNSGHLFQVRSLRQRLVQPLLHPLIVRQRLHRRQRRFGDAG